MYALSSYSHEYYAVEKLDIQTSDENEFCVMALQKNGIPDYPPYSKIPVLLLKKHDGNKKNVIIAELKSFEIKPHTIGEGLQSITPYKSGFSIQQSFAGGQFLYISHLYFDYEGKDRFRLVRYTEEHIDRYAEDKDFTEIDYKIDDNTYFEDINSDWVYNMHCEGTVKMHYKSEFVEERIDLPPELREGMDSNSIIEYGHDRTFLLISRSDGANWYIEIPRLPDFDETSDGFSLRFSWSDESERYSVNELFFFKEIDGEPCLYKIDSTVYDYYTYNHLTEELSRAIEPPIKISELNADKISSLLENLDE